MCAEQRAKDPSRDKSDGHGMRVVLVSELDDQRSKRLEPSQYRESGPTKSLGDVARQRERCCHEELEVPRSPDPEEAECKEGEANACT